MAILITGANGFVGRFLCHELNQKGYLIRAAVRSLNNRLKNFEEIEVGSIDSTTNWTSALKNIDVVIHLAARVHVMQDNAVNPLEAFRKVNVEGTKCLALAAAKSGVKRFIFLSTVKVNGEKTSKNKPLTEDAPPAPKDDYGLSKHEAERILLEISKDTGMEIVIIRPPLVYGEGVKANFASMLRAVRNRVPMPFGNVKNLRSFVYVGNLISLIVRCVDHPNAANQTFFVSDGCDLSTTQLLQRCADVLDVKPILFSVPQSWIKGVIVFFGRNDLAQRLLGDLQLNISKARILLEWTPSISVIDGLKATVQGLKESEK
jgi:nucleoside-diphosphate-sugar epimerase